MNLAILALLATCFVFVNCTVPIDPTSTSVIQIPLADTIVVPTDTVAGQVDSCQEKLSNLRQLNGCPEFVGGFLNDYDFFANADVTIHDNIAVDHFAINIRSFRDGGWYAFDLALTFNGTPDISRVYPLTTDGEDLATWHAVDSDSAYVALGFWLDFADLNPPLAYKFVSGLTNWVRVDSSSNTIYQGEPVTDHFGALEATLVLNQTQYIQDNVQYYINRGFCVPDTIFLRDVCFDARTRDVNGPCRRKAGR